jgi:hypothetical protein
MTSLLGKIAVAMMSDGNFRRAAITLHGKKGRCFSRWRASALGGNPASARMLIFQDDAIAACSF